MSARNCVTHHICECHAEKMWRLEDVATAARELLDAVDGILWYSDITSSTFDPLMEALEALDRQGPKGRDEN